MLQVALGPPPDDFRRQLRSQYPRMLWRRWCHAGIRGPLSLLAVLVAILILGALMLPPPLDIKYALTAVVGPLAIFFVTPFLVGHQLRRTRPDAPAVIWCRDGDRWAFIRLRHRRDGSWAASNFVSTGGGIGGQLVTFGLAMADDRQTPIHLITRGARLIRYYQDYGFTIDRRRRAVLFTAMTYLP
ncbi:MAG: hypothetical protein QOH97_3533, partial [Actinoplanes sp.]|nr:hypothetical protein [Actinoplanes sp.]